MLDGSYDIIKGRIWQQRRRPQKLEERRKPLRSAPVQDSLQDGLSATRDGGGARERMACILSRRRHPILPPASRTSHT